MAPTSTGVPLEDVVGGGERWRSVALEVVQRLMNKVMATQQSLPNSAAKQLQFGLWQLLSGWNKVAKSRSPAAASRDAPGRAASSPPKWLIIPETT
ncbi:hypothetical protein M5D96_003530 [Drosophila gunungcola]|uniref:Uncharacterized protein n=1 Tax=Drosophila gunungcola TaxID=103775 RepID=A0A9P9YSD0_9MUSC|nr:hypothetical protein M5D96_003530 [Drosophila gunungcola]